MPPAGMPAAASMSGNSTDISKLVDYLLMIVPVVLDAERDIL